MNYNKHFNLEGKHAFLGASQSTWLRKTEDQIIDSFARQYIQSIGTALHDIVRKHIKHRVKLTKSAKKEIFLSLVEDYHVPPFAIECGIDFDAVFENLMEYTNDAIGYRMVPEQILYYSDYCFGTADAISDLDSVILNRSLRIHDLKTGLTRAHIEQLEIYTALFCLEYNIKPSDIDIELRIYQSQKDEDDILHPEVLILNPTAEDIVPIMDKIISIDKKINSIIEEI